MTPDETPDLPDTPVTTESADTTDWQKRYSDLQPEYTRATQALKDEQSVWEDEQAALQRLAEKFPHLFEGDDTEDEDVYEDDETPAAPAPDPRIDWLATKEAERQFEADFTRFTGDRTVLGKGREWIEARSRHIADSTGKKWGPDTLKVAVDEYFEHAEEIAAAHLERVTQSKKAPHTPAGGKAGTTVPTLDTHEERRQFYRQRIAEKQSQQ